MIDSQCRSATIKAGWRQSAGACYSVELSAADLNNSPPTTYLKRIARPARNLEWHFEDADSLCLRGESTELFELQRSAERPTQRLDGSLDNDPRPQTSSTQLVW